MVTERDNGHELLQKKLHLYIRRKIIIMRTSSSLKMFKIQIDRTLDNAFERSGFNRGLDQMISGDLLQPRLF